MKGISIGLNKARMVDDRGITFTLIRDGNLWVFEGIAYENPFKAFNVIERMNEKWRKQLGICANE